MENQTLFPSEFVDELNETHRKIFNKYQAFQYGMNSRLISVDDFIATIDIVMIEGLENLVNLGALCEQLRKEWEAHLEEYFLPLGFHFTVYTALYDEESQLWGVYSLLREFNYTYN